MIYLNNAATSWPKPETVYQTMDIHLRGLKGSVNRGTNIEALTSARAVFETRELLAAFFGIRKPERVVFTANATEALNIALQGILNPGDHAVLSSMEHNAVARPMFAMQNKGVDFTIVDCSPDGELDPLAVAEAIKPRTKLICLTHASNVSGSIMPVYEVGEIARRNNLEYLVDAAQTAGKIPIDVESAGITLLAFTGHKGLFGPPGTGGLYIGNPENVRPLIYGGTGSSSELFDQPKTMPDRFESGTLNAPAVAALGAGIKYIMEIGLSEITRHNREITAILLEGLQSIPGVVVHGCKEVEEMVPVLSVTVEGISPGEASLWLAENYGIVTRSGLHCAPLAHRTLNTIDTGTLRFSPGYFNTREQMRQTVAAVKELVELTAND